MPWIAPALLRAPLVLLAACATLACGTDDSATPGGPTGPDPLTFAVDASGPFEVGYRATELTYSAPAGVGDRTLKVNLWYPTEDTTGRTVVYEYGLQFPDADVFEGASLAPSVHADGYPVVVFSHGDRGFGGNASDIHHRFASHGWVVIAPDHLGNTLDDNVQPRRTELYFERPLDVSAALDWLEAPPAEEPLAGLVDMSRVIMSGHSFGVYSTWAIGGATYDLPAMEVACAAGQLSEGCTPAVLDVFRAGLSDPRVKAIIPMAGGRSQDWFGEDGLDAIPVPVLLMSGGADGGLPTELPGLMDGIDTADVTWVEFAGGGHQLFGLSCPDDPMCPEVATYPLAFARYHLFADRTAPTAALVEGTTVTSPAVSYRRAP